MFKALTRRLIPSVYARLDTDARLGVADLVSRNFEETTYRRLAGLGFAPDGYIDVGAYHGNWTRLANKVLGQKPSLMVEGQAALLPALESYAATRSDLSVYGGVLSATSGEEVSFYEMGTGSSIFAEASNAPRERKTVTTHTLDEVAADFLTTVAAPFLKIDVQGAELKILAGGAKVLERASLVQLEVAMLPYNKGAPLMPEVVAWMAERGWLPTEISGFSRPSGPLVQIDLLFARADSPLRPSEFRF
ncbi:FkbM family methyltransferase [Sphingomonas panacisoli]|uniref:FkbM family methyltransferase n=1 Tax=Sphingomonas panacisoli TaxID=1813879 RepID=A0A5B8LJC2_9SPHN|nr:FkbM family methyltransferase [Sphingomonas panacisoli]QDZ08056.1 FkbM family methyltransferase [Sphingomonas panacisoli]